MTGEKMWQEFCHSTNTDSNTRHDIWKDGNGKCGDCVLEEFEVVYR